MVRLANVRMRSMLLLVQFLCTCSGIEFKQPDEHSCEKMLRETSGTTDKCMCESGKCTLSVTLEFGLVQIPAASTGLKGELHMLGFNVPDSPGRSPGPTLRVRAGDTLKILLKNNMPPELISTSTTKTGNNGFHDFSVVNLHTHGLHVSPLAPGDEVVNTRVKPNQTHQYIYHIPDDHMGGTHWYHPHWHGAVSIHVNFGAAGMIIVEDAVNQLPVELASMEDYIVATFNVDYDDITDITNGYVQNCICDLPGNTANCFDQPCEIDPYKYPETSGPTLWKSWGEYIKSNASDQYCPDNEFDILCVQKNCKDVSKDDGEKVSSFGTSAISCAAQAEPFFRNPEGYAPPGSSLVLVNGQLEPTLTITADTWVRLRLGFMATGNLLAPVIDDACQMLLLAKDGVYLPTAPRAVEQGLLASGNRADVLINCPPGDTWTFSSAKLVVEGFPGSDVIETVLLHINSVVDKDAPQQCDLPVFEVNRPCYLVDLRGQEVAKNLTFFMAGPTYFYGIANATDVPPGTEFSYDKKMNEQYNAPVGEVLGFEVHNVNRHPFHIHINPFQLTVDQPLDADQWKKDWFQSGDWHDNLFMPGNGGKFQRVLMNSDFFTGPTVVHCHILFHEDNGMMIQINFTGTEGSRYPPAYGDTETCRVMDTCTTPLIDPTCYSGSEMVKLPTEDGTRIGNNCPPASSPSLPPPNVLAFKAATATAVAATATAEANTWKVTTIVLGVVLAVVLLLVAAVFLAMRGTANSGAAPETEMI